MSSLFRTKTIEESIAETGEEEYKLKKNLSALDLTVFGIGVVIGAGIFTVTGLAARDNAGPAVTLSFVIAAVCCALAALCYAEFASTVPVSGSAYTFSYASLGEIVAWIIGWDLVMEMLLAAGLVSQGWSYYLAVFLKNIGITVPEAIGVESKFNLLAFLLVLVLTALVAKGIKESLRVNMALVALKLFIVLFVIFAGIQYINPANYTPFVPDAIPAEAKGGTVMTSPLVQTLFGFSPTTYGLGGIIAAAAIVFFAYIGFDVVATTAEEAKNPKRDLPIGIIGSLVICTILYIAVALVITGMVHYDQISPRAPLATAFTSVGQPHLATWISAGATAGLTTVVMTLLIGSTRVIFAMCRDHLLPAHFGTTNPKTGTPVKITVTIGIVIAFVAALAPLGALEELVNIGTLAAFALVSVAVPALRKRRPDYKRAFSVPFSPFVPYLSAAICIWLMLNLPLETWIRFVVWMGVGFVIYFTYSRHHSRLAGRDSAAPATESGSRVGG